jgi:hypothetical protein
VGFVGELVSVIRVFQRLFGMPVRRLVIALFIVFGGGTMGAGSEFMVLGGFSSPPKLLFRAPTAHGQLTLGGRKPDKAPQTAPALSGSAFGPSPALERLQTQKGD